MHYALCIIKKGVVFMTHKERFIRTLKREPVKGLVPTFELVFFLTMEKFGKVHFTSRRFSQWTQMSKREQELQITDQAQLYIDIAKAYGHSAIFVQQNPDDKLFNREGSAKPYPESFPNTERILSKIRELSGDEYFLTMHGDTTCGIPDGDNMLEFSARLYEDPEGIIKDEEKYMNAMLNFAENINKRGKLLDGFTMCADYCFNTNPYFSPDIFGEVVAPVLKKTIDAYRSMGFYSIKHTDGNIMPIADILVQCGPDALHSLDPQGGVDLKHMMDKYGDKVTMCGNVNCALLQTGTDEEVTADVKRALKDGMSRGKGFIFCTSNCVYTGMPLERYEMMMRLWREFGEYK
jgi:uroporphyrinogen decarboxylase